MSAAVASTRGQMTIAPGSIVEVRDEERLVTAAETTEAGKLLIRVQSLSKLVRDTTATFYESLDSIKPVDPRLTKVVGDGSSKYSDTRLWLEANRRKIRIPLAEQQQQSVNSCHAQTSTHADIVLASKQSSWGLTPPKYSNARHATHEDIPSSLSNPNLAVATALTAVPTESPTRVKFSSQ